MYRRQGTRGTCRGEGDTQLGHQTGKIHMRKHSCICMWYAWRIPEKRTNTGRGNRSRGRIPRGLVQDVDGPTRAVWSHPDTDQGDCSPERSPKERWSCSLETGALLLISSQLKRAYHNDHRSRRSSTLNTPRARQIWTRKWAQHGNDRCSARAQNIKGYPAGSRSNATATA